MVKCKCPISIAMTLLKGWNCWRMKIIPFYVCYAERFEYTQLFGWTVNMKSLLGCREKWKPSRWKMKLKKIKLILWNWLEVLPESSLSPKHRQNPQMYKHSLGTNQPGLKTKAWQWFYICVFWTVNTKVASWLQAGCFCIKLKSH